MNSTLRKLLWMALATATPELNWAMDIRWTRMAGQWPVEASPLVGRFSESGLQEILVLNRGGQLLLWSADGTAIGPGQDGAVALLPQGQWTTAPMVLAPSTAARFVIASVEGLVVGLDTKFQLVWQFKLPGQTMWGRALPAVVRTASGPTLVFNDLSGTATCLTPAGKVGWTNALTAGPCKAPPQILSLRPGQDLALIPAGSTLFCCDAAGNTRWRSELGGEIVTRPEVLSLANRELILCGTAAGALIALDFRGTILWQCATEDTFSNWIAFLPRRGAGPLILFTGLWGNLHAVDVQGRHVWTHLFRAKNRAAPLVLDADRDGRLEIFVPTFHQHVLEFDQDGLLKDDIRLSGIMPAAVTPISEPGTTNRDLLVTTTTLLAYRLRPGPPKSPYGTTPEARDVRLHFTPTDNAGEQPALIVENPAGALLSVQLSTTNASGGSRLIMGRLTARPTIEIPLASVSTNGDGMWLTTVRDSTGKVLQEQTWSIPSVAPAKSNVSPNTLLAWATQPYAAFDESRLSPPPREFEAGTTNTVSIQTLYLDEADEAGFAIASSCAETSRVSVALSRLTRSDGVPFGGSKTLHELVATGSINGERVPDALPALGDGGVLTLPPRRATKLWLSVDARGAQSGDYTGHVSIASLDTKANKLELPVQLEVLNLRLPREFPLTLCTWDYITNRWFPSRSKEVLDDMSRHGVNVFPRNTIPPGRVDSAGKLTIDWTLLDAELDRLQGRGKILFHLNHPPIEFAAKPTDEAKHGSELEYIRALRDHLRERGRDYADYAFYLLDEPGLDYGPNITILLDAGKLFREADPKLLTYTDPVPGLSWKDFERIEPLVDVWAPNMRLVSGLLSGDPRIARILKQKTVWSYECVGQVKSLSPLRYNRANAWRAKFFGLSGIGFWTHSTTQADPWQSDTSKNDEYALVYPGDLPVPSVRWEAARDGLEDVAAMALLDEQIRRHWDAGTKNELVQEAEQALRIALRDVMELSDEAFVESRDFLRAGDRVLGHTWTDVEMFRRHRAEIARLTVALAGE